MTTIRKDKKWTVSFYLLAFLSFVLFLSSCGAPEGQFQLEGHFKNINQGEFYIYDLEHGRKDTIVLRDGRFSYNIAMTDTTVLTLLFPNFSELPIFAQPGAKVKIDGDVTHLRETTIKGTQANKQMTAFREAVNDMTPKEAASYAEQFIKDNPQSILCTYLLRRYFLTCTEPDYKKAAELCAIMQKAQPQNISVVRLLNQLTPLKNTKYTGKLPTFKTVDIKGDTVTNKHFSNKVGVICLWSSWNFESQNMLRLVRTLQKENATQLAVMSVSIDDAPSEGQNILKRDSITWPNICDSTMWKSPLLQILSLHKMPDNIIVDKNSNIVGRGLNNADLKQKIDSLLKL